jgi:CAAD domains of cyanobacterial aminoacyl-tRNA synthetase
MSETTVSLDRTEDTDTLDVPVNPLGMNANDSASITQVYPETTTNELPDWMKQVGTILAELPNYLGQLYQENKGVVITLGGIFAVIVAVKLTLAILAAVNGIPLLAPTFQLVGIGYTAWFVSRYLLQASTREELNSQIDGLKSEIFGNYDNN